MSGHRETCDELIAAGENATARPWWRHVNGVRGGDGDGDAVIGAPSESVRISKGDARYLLAATNNADRLARFSDQLSREAMLLWAKLHRVKIGIDGIPAFNEMVARLWEESK